MINLGCRNEKYLGWNCDLNDCTENVFENENKFELNNMLIIYKVGSFKILFETVHTKK